MSNTAYKSATLADQNLNITKQVGSVDRQKKQIDLQVATTAYGEVIKNLEIAKITLQKETPLIQIIDQPIYPLKKEKISKLMSLINWGGISGFFSVIFLLTQRWYRKTMKTETVDIYTY